MGDEFDAQAHAKTCFEALSATDAYLGKEVLPVVAALLCPNDTEIAFQASLYRLAVLLRSLVRLDGVQHFQAICAVARTIFEVRIDVELLDRGSEGDIERFHAFPSIERFRSAERLLETIERTGTPHEELPVPVTGARSVVTDERREEIRNLIKRLWPERDVTKRGAWPKHWSGVEDLAARCAKLGPRMEVEYAQFYSVLSWHVHPGATGYAGKEGAFFDLMCAWSYDQSRVWLTEALRISARRLRLNEAIDRFGRNTLTLMSLSELTGEVAAAARRADKGDSG